MTSTWPATRSHAFRNVLAVLGIYLSLGAAAAFADDLPKEGREALKRGIDAARQKQWSIAQSEFDAAYKLSSSAPEVLFNLALLNDQIGGRELRAIAWYRAFLAASPKAIIRDKIQTRIMALEEAALASGRQLVEKAISANQQLPAHDQTSWLASIASANASLGSVPTALSMAGPFIANANSAGANGIYQSVATSCAKVGNLAGADEAIQRITDTEARMSAMAAVVSELTNQKKFTQAQAYASQIQGANRVSAYANLAKAQSQGSDKSAVLQSLKTAIEAVAIVQNPSAYLYKQLVEVASELGEIEDARRLFTKITDNSIRSQATSDFVIALAKARLFDEAETLATTITRQPYETDDFWKVRATNAIDEARKAQIREFIAVKNLVDAETLLEKIVRPGANTDVRLELAKTYREAGDLVASLRQIEIAAGKAAKSAGQNQLVQLVGAYGEQAAAERKVNDAAKAKSAALKAIKILSRITAKDVLIFSVSSLAASDTIEELAKVAAVLPEGYVRQTVFQDLTSGLAATGHGSKAVAASKKIIDRSARNSTLINAAVQRVDADDLKTAIELAHAIDEPEKARDTYIKIATKMAVLGLFKEAAVLEAKFAGSAGESGYFYTLAGELARSGAFDDAVRTALRMPTAQERMDNLLSVASAIEQIAGVEAAKPLVKQALEQVAASGTADEVSCSQASKVAGNIFDDGDKEKLVISACSAAAFLQPQVKDRGDKLSTLASRFFSSQLPVPRSHVGPFVSQVSNSELEEYAWQNAELSLAASLAQEGAIDYALSLIGQRHPYSINIYSTAIKWLVESGDKKSAQRILNTFLAEVELRPNQSSKDDGLVAAINMILLMGDLEQATALISRISSVYQKGASLRSVAAAAAASGNKGKAIALLKEADMRFPESGNTNDYVIVGIYGAAEDFDSAQHVAERTIKAELFWRRYAWSAYLEALLKKGEQQRLPKALEMVESLYGTANRQERKNMALDLAKKFAWANDTARLQKLLADYEAPGFRSQLLMEAARGYATAGKSDEAYKMLSQALDVLKIKRPDYEDWAAHVVAVAEGTVDTDAAARRILTIKNPRAQAYGVDVLVSNWLASNRSDAALALLQLAPSSVFLDKFLLQAARVHAGKGDITRAREMIAKILDPGRRDHAVRQLIIIQARAGNFQQALADAGTIADPANRAYVLLDLAAMWSASGDLPRASMTYAAVSELAEKLTDPTSRASIFAEISRGLDAIDLAPSGGAYKKAMKAAQSIENEQMRIGMVKWIEDFKNKSQSASVVTASNGKVDPIAAEEIGYWTYYAQNTLSGELHSSREAYIQSLSSKPANEIVSALASSAEQFGLQLADMRRKITEFQEKRSAASK